MKTLTLILFTFFMNDTTRYEKAMLENIQAISTAEDNQQMQQIVNTFHRIAQNEADRWEPLYYAGYSQLLMVFREESASLKDKYLDLALADIEKAYKIAPDESELVAMEGFVHMIRVTIDPATRGQQFAGLSMQAFQKALVLNPENPRAMYLAAQMEMGTARFFGSDVAPTCEKLKAAVEKFDSVKSDNILAPTWGKKQAEGALSNCQ